MSDSPEAREAVSGGIVIFLHPIPYKRQGVTPGDVARGGNLICSRSFAF